jgi:hypothetical protein
MKQIGALSKHEKHHFLNSLIGLNWMENYDDLTERAFMVKYSFEFSKCVFKSYWENSCDKNPVMLLLAVAWLDNPRKTTEKCVDIISSDKYVQPRVLLIGSEDQVRSLRSIIGLEKMSTMYQGLLVPASLETQIEN